jgi:hypothetical protein
MMTRRRLFGYLASVPIAARVGWFIGLSEGGRFDPPIEDQTQFHTEFVFELPEGVEFKYPPSTLAALFASILIPSTHRNARMGYFQTTKPMRIVQQDGHLTFEAQP